MANHCEFILFNYQLLELDLRDSGNIQTLYNTVSAVIFLATKLNVSYVEFYKNWRNFSGIQYFGFLFILIPKHVVRNGVFI